MNHQPLTKCSCMLCDCDLTTMEDICYECTRGLHALNEWKSGYKVRMKPKSPKTTGEMKTETILQMNVDNAEMSVRVDVMMDLLMEILKFAIIDVFEGKKCKLCGGIIGVDRNQEDLQHKKDCPLLKIPKLKGD